MPYRKVLTWPDSRLLNISEPVDVSAGLDFITADINDVVDTLNVEMGLGLAAPQIGILKRIIAINATFLDESSQKEIPKSSLYRENFLVMINPILSLSGDVMQWHESCLSVPGYSALVKRPSTAHVSFIDINNDHQEISASWPLAGILQHECDHLDGILYLRHTSNWERTRIQKKILKANKRKVKLAAELARREKLEQRGIDPDSPEQKRKENLRNKKRKKRNVKKRSRR